MDKDFQKAIKAQFGKDVEVYTWQEVRDAFKKFNYTREDAIKFYLSKGSSEKSAIEITDQFFSKDGVLREG
jgi:hypothetical protein